MWGRDDAFWQVLDVLARDDYLKRPSGVTEARSHIDSSSDVVVALEQQGKPRSHANTYGERRTGGSRALLKLESERDGISLVNSHEHAAIAQPLGNADTGLRGHLTGDGTP
jgi:hypothetical protein